MFRTLLALLSLCLILSLSAGSTVLAEQAAAFDTVSAASHAAHPAAEVPPGCSQAQAQESDEPCLDSSHCTAGAMPFIARLPLPARADRPLSPAPDRAAPPPALKERPPRSA
ncbi:hypothetical protein [Billgrantia lactosivorans]|uniref:hypothetical protein n=1 Tax=Billgrantia lactosivorans TaxID=2185141 RepID=UPI000DADD6DB|nr:hypothetical protein [Halomonas lactosivorans]